MILATIEFPHGSRIDLGKDGYWAGTDTMVAESANAFIPSLKYEPKVPINRAFGVVGYAVQVASALDGKVIFVRDHPKPELLRQSEGDIAPSVLHDRIATVSFPNGDVLHIDVMNVWTGNNPVLVATANAYDPPGDVYRPFLAACIAEEIAELLGGKVIFVKKQCNRMPSDTVY